MIHVDHREDEHGPRTMYLLDKGSNVHDPNVEGMICLTPQVLQPEVYAVP